MLKGMVHFQKLASKAVNKFRVVFISSFIGRDSVTFYLRSVCISLLCSI